MHALLLIHTGGDSSSALTSKRLSPTRPASRPDEKPTDHQHQWCTQQHPQSWPQWGAAMWDAVYGNCDTMDPLWVLSGEIINSINIIYIEFYCSYFVHEKCSLHCCEPCTGLSKYCGESKGAFTAQRGRCAWPCSHTLAQPYFGTAPQDDPNLGISPAAAVHTKEIIHVDPSSCTYMYMYTCITTRTL